MKITESRLRKLIRQVIKETYELPEEDFGTEEENEATPGAEAYRHALELGEDDEDIRDYSGMDPDYNPETDSYWNPDTQQWEPANV